MFTRSRVVMIFRVRSARKLAITDNVLLKRLSAMILLYLSYLTVWMVIQPPLTESSVTTDKLKYKRCSKGWFGNIILAGKNVSSLHSEGSLPAYQNFIVITPTHPLEIFCFCLQKCK